MPVVASYCFTFLNREMLHVYRQMAGLQSFKQVVFCNKQKFTGSFPFDPDRIFTMPRPITRSFKRLWYRRIRGLPIQIYQSEARLLLSQLMKYRTDVLHIYFGDSAVNLLPLIRMCPFPVVVSFHGADIGLNMDDEPHRKAMEEVVQRAELVFARSQSLIEGLQIIECPKEIIRLQRAGIPLQDWTFQPRKVPPENGRWQFLQACRLCEKKGIPTAMQAFKQVLGKYPNSVFKIAGEGHLLDDLAATAAALGIADNIEFCGFLEQDELRKLVYDSHIFIHPSQMGADGDREGVPNSMLEAIATGLPVLATHHGGIPEAVKTGVSGHLVEEGDADGLAAAAMQMLDDPDRYRHLSQGAARAVRESFEQKAQIAALESYYLEAIDRYRSRAIATAAA